MKMASLKPLPLIAADIDNFPDATAAPAPVFVPLTGDVPIAVMFGILDESLAWGNCIGTCQDLCDFRAFFLALLSSATYNFNPSRCANRSSTCCFSSSSKHERFMVVIIHILVKLQA